MNMRSGIIKKNGPTGLLVLALVLMVGCGRPKPSGGPPSGDMPTPAVVAKLQPIDLDITIDLVAGLESTESVRLVSEVDSTVLAVEVKEGQAVVKGDVLFRLDDVQTGAQLAEAEAAFRLATLTHERNEGLLKNQTISQQEYDEASSGLSMREAVLTRIRDLHRKTTVKAPFDGVVGEKAVSAGQFVRFGDELIDLIRMDELELVADVPERHLNAVKDGQSVLFESDAFPGKSFSGVLHYIAPQVTVESRTVRIKAGVSNEDGRLKPGLFGRVKLVVESRSDALMIPETAVSFSNAGRTVIRVNGEGRAEFVPVVTGQRAPGRVEITSGLEAGDIVVIEGGQKMGPGSLVMAAGDSASYGVPLGPIGTPKSVPENGEEDKHGSD